jgi:adenylate cyclase
MASAAQNIQAKPNASVLRRATRLMNELGPGRIIATFLFLAIALVAARYSWNMWFVEDAERALYDQRVRLMAPQVEQDPRIAMIVYTDDTLINTKKRSPLDRATLAKALTSLDQMGAKSIGIDILIDQPQDEDEVLVKAFKAMKTPTHLAYADIATNADQIGNRQQLFLDRFMTRLAGSKTSPASIRIESDGDNVVRSWPEIKASLPPFLARAMAGQNNAFADYTRSIAYRLPIDKERPVFASYPIDLFTDSNMAAAFADQIEGRHILIGGDIVDMDQFDTPITPFTGKQMIGLEVHAHMLAQLLDHNRPIATPRWASWLVGVLVVIAGGITSLIEGKVWRTALFVVVQIAFFGGLPIWLQGHGTDTQFLPAFGWIIGWIIAFSSVGTAARQIGTQQRKFAQSALGKYLPRDIANEILNEPDRLALHGEKREIFVIFTDLQGFTELSHQIAPEMVATLLNRYLDMLCTVVLDYGGTIDKFVGDAVVAFWGAPISRPDDGERAARAAYAMWEAGETFRTSAPADVPPIGKTRVGLHFGEAVIGNFGGEGRIQYTALGDSMNTASRLESANKQLDSNILVSREAAERSGLDWWRPMGRVQLRGRAQPVDIFEPVPNMSLSDLHHMRDIFALLKTNLKEARAQLSILVKSRPDDKPLANLLHRIEHANPGGFYVLD